MDVEQMSNEELAGLLEGTEVNYNASVLDESANRLRTGMHWLPMTDDAVFEDARQYLIEDVAGARFTAHYEKSQDGFSFLNRPWRRCDITHYARITEPK